MAELLFRLLAGLLIGIMTSSCAWEISTAHRKDGAEKVAKPSPVKPPTPKPPAWVLGKGHPNYPSNAYLTGIGVHGESSVTANESARVELAKILRVKIKSIMVGKISTDMETHIESFIKTEVNTILEGVEIKDGWYDKTKGNYYTFAVVERSLAADNARDRIESLQTRIQQNIKKGNDAEAQGNIITALNNYLAGFQKAPTILPLKIAYRVITRSSNDVGTGGHSADDFVSLINGIVHNIKLDVVSGNDQQVKAYQNLTDPLVARIYLQKGSTEIPLQNIPVVFNYNKGSGELEKEKSSDTNGEVSTKVHKITSLDEKHHTVTAKLDFEKFSSSFDRKFSRRLLSPLRNVETSFDYSIDKIHWPGKSQTWKSGIADLVNQLIKSIRPGGNPVVGVFDFEDMRNDGTTPFSKVLKEDIKNILVQAKDLTVKELDVSQETENQLLEIAKKNGLDLYIKGSYRIERGGLEISALLIETASNAINSSANILVNKEAIHSEDLALLEKAPEPPLGPSKQAKPLAEDYDKNLEKLIQTKPEKPAFNINVWTNKKEYQIGEKITFSIKAEKNCYLTLLDIGSEGNVTVIFPNKYHKDNFIRAGVTYQVPAPDYGFLFDIQGPPGLERIKAIASLSPDPLIDLNLEQGFHSIDRGTRRGTRDIKTIAKKFSPQLGSNWAEAYSEIFIFEKNKKYYRGSRKVPILEKPRKSIDMIGTFGKEEPRIQD